MAQDRGPFRSFGRVRLFTLFGFEVKLDLSWLLLALLITWSLGAGVFPVEYPDLPRPVYAWMGVACAIGVFFSIVFHEFSHSLVARHFGMPIKGITLSSFLIHWSRAISACRSRALRYSYSVASPRWKRNRLARNQSS
jgi:Zn-dependent protease